MDPRYARATADISGYVPHDEDRIGAYLETGDWRNLTFHDVVDRTADAAPDRPAVVGPDRTLTYGTLAANSRSLAAAFHRELGLRPDDMVTLQLLNCPEFVEAFMACSRLGVIPAFVLPRHRRREVEHVVGLSDSRAVVTVADRYDPRFDYVGMIDAIADSSSELHRIAVTADGSDPPSGWTEFARLRDGPTDGRDAFEELDVNPCNPGLLMLSGGTSGLPKLIPRTHNDYLYQWEHIAEALGVGDGWTFVAGIPIGHSFTIGYILGPALWSGGTVALEPALKPGPLARTIDRTSGDVTALIPKQLIDLLDQDGDHDLRTLRVVCSGGQKVPPDLTRRVVDRWDVGFSHVFGMGEGPQLITRPDDPLEVQAMTIGRPLGEGDEVRILDPEGGPVDGGEPGELVFRGPGTTSGYLRNPAANAEAFEPGGWFHTGDVVSRRSDGNYEVWGRLDDTINRAGETIYAPAVEDALVGHPAVKKAAVVGIPDEALGERVGAAVELEPDATGLSLDEVAAYFADEGYAVYQRPERLVVVEELPETQVGKLDRAAVKPWFDEGSGRDAS